MLLIMQSLLQDFSVFVVNNLVLTTKQNFRMYQSRKFDDE